MRESWDSNPGCWVRSKYATFVLCSPYTPQNNLYMTFFVSSWYKDLYHKTFGAGGERGSEHDDEELADQDDERD